jgi:hypothetical protein
LFATNINFSLSRYRSDKTVEAQFYRSKKTY